jgi:hypothetical protein
MISNLIQTCSNLIQSKQDLLEIKFFEKIMVLKDLMIGTSLLIETSLDSKWFLNEKSGNLLGFEIQ